ncbi:MAG: aminotransferase class III-fold pyridoxal phosphate-dependent enzyme [Candidatus Hydrogenedentes bacterium]|nr:aminotransferase class III-fold pyridoxal phosphate-dependent enzyme [Candidatus Hydrogenedentota bacterium]
MADDSSGAPAASQGCGAECEPREATYTYAESGALFRRAAQVIPCGIYGHLSPAPCTPVSAYPFFAERGRGARFWDVDGNEFIDYMCAYGPMILGYNHPVVDEAYQAQMRDGNALTCASRKMVELAEYLVDLVPMAGWAYFAKNGGDVTQYATMVARAATGRDKIIAIRGGYHGVEPWMQSPGHDGTIAEDHGNVIRIAWNDVAALEGAIAENPGRIAGFIATPYHHPSFADSEWPGDGYWARVETLLRKEGIVFIIDDVRCGFRLGLRGSNEYFGFTPDLICFCKALANGYPISALVGTDALKRDASKVFYTGSYWFSAAPMAAALACLEELKRIDGPKRMIETGTRLIEGLVAVARSHGFDLRATGAPSLPYLRLTDDESLMLHQDWCGECTRRGAYFTSHHNWFLSTAHTDEDLQRTWDIADDAFKAIRKNRAG